MALLDDKALEIEAVLNQEEVDLWRLRELALSEGGLVNDTLRKRAWPKLVGLHDLWSEDSCTNESSQPSGRRESTTSVNPPTLSGLPPRPNKTLSVSLESHLIQDNTPASDTNSVGSDHSTTSDHGPLVPQSSCIDADQISLDVLRCTWHLLTGTQRVQRIQMEHKRNRRVARLIRKKQQRLALLINATLTKTYLTTNLRYYQGYHDVACIVLSALGGVSGLPVQTATTNTVPPADADLASAVLLQISEHHLRDCLQTNFISLQTALRCTIFPLLALLDPDVHAHLYQCGMEPFFALSWVLTWFAHEVRDTDAVKRLFDAFLVSHALLPVYMSVAMVIHPTNREEILDCECDFSLLHQTLRGLPKNSSMVGWKYRPGDGYVSDDDHGDDNGTVSTMDSGTAEAEILLVERLDHDYNKIRQMREDHTASLVSSNLSSLEPPAPVSFQELIDNALDIMRRIPPRKLLQLATRYYGKPAMEEMLSQCDVIHMFDPNLPVYMTQNAAKADWVYRQEAKERKLEGYDRRTRRIEPRRSRSRSPSLGRSPSMTFDVDELSMKEQIALSRDYIQTHLKSSAVIALGFGSGDDAERRRRKRRKMVVRVAVVLLAVAVGMAMRYGSQEHVTQSTDPRSSDLKPLAAAFTDTVSASNDLKESTITEAESNKNDHEVAVGLQPGAEGETVVLSTEPILIEQTASETIDDDASFSFSDGEASLVETLAEAVHIQKTKVVPSDHGDDEEEHQEWPDSFEDPESWDGETPYDVDDVKESDDELDDPLEGLDESTDFDDDFEDSQEYIEDDNAETVEEDEDELFDYSPEDELDHEDFDIIAPSEAGVHESFSSPVMDDAIEFGSHVIDFVSALSTPVWGLVRENCTNVFALAKKLSLRESARAKAYFDYIQQVGLSSHLTSLLNEAHGLLTENQVCSTNSDPIHEIARTAFGLQDAPTDTHGMSDIFGQWVAAVASSHEWQTLKHHSNIISEQIRQYGNAYYSAYALPQWNLFVWMSSGVWDEIKHSAAGQRVHDLYERISRSRVCQNVRRSMAPILPAAANVISQASVFHLYKERQASTE